MTSMIVDVREPSEFIRGHVKGAVNIPAGEIARGASRLHDLPKDTRLVVYCNSGSRSGAVERWLKSQGFVNVVNGINSRRVEAALELGEL